MLSWAASLSVRVETRSYAQTDVYPSPAPAKSLPKIDRAMLNANVDPTTSFYRAQHAARPAADQQHEKYLLSQKVCCMARFCSSRSGGISSRLTLLPPKNP